MSRQLRVAAIQMDAVPASVTHRLARAGDLIAEAVAHGAQLVVLPELFNTGYQYDSQNVGLAEAIDGETIAWMHEQARVRAIYLAGTLMLRENGEIYNTAFMIAPDGRRWRYDKQYPWLWERTYFRAGPIREIAQTDLGDFGMIICWDAAHPRLWAQYAGKVDAVIMMSCPPKMSSPDLVFPDGKRVPQRKLGGFYAWLHTDEEYFPGIDMERQAGWLGVPAVATVGGGRVKLRLPRPYLAMSFFTLLRPDLWRRFRQFKEVFLETGFDHQTKIVDETGQVLSRVSEDGDGLTVSEITLADTKPVPQQAQPRMQTLPFVYFISDVLPRWALGGLYKQYING
jgi:predicted amidohydrolase